MANVTLWITSMIMVNLLFTTYLFGKLKQSINFYTVLQFHPYIKRIRFHDYQYFIDYKKDLIYKGIKHLQIINI